MSQIQQFAEEAQAFDFALPIIKLADYNNVHPDYRGVWSTERTDIPNWPVIRERHMGKRTLMRNGGLEIEGISFLIQE